MNLAIPKNRKELKQYPKGPLYRNSFFIMLTSISAVSSSFIFWMLVANLYPKEDVGVATALIASMALLVLLSKFGFDQPTIRFFTERDKSKIFSMSVVITTFFTVPLGVIFITGIDICSPKLYIIKNIVFLYPIFLVANSIASLTRTSFVALGKVEYYFLQNLILGLRVIFLSPFIFLEHWKYSVLLAYLLSLLLYFRPFFRFRIKSSGIDRELNVKVILTDFGGIQEGTCILEVGSNVLSAVNQNKILKGVKLMLSKEKNWKDPFDDGKVGKRIIEIIGGML